jgi:hypothetical protein
MGLCGHQGNTAPHGSGGAVSYQQNATGSASLTDDTFVNNSAAVGGAVAGSAGASMGLQSCRLSGNLASEGGAVRCPPILAWHN